MDGSADKLLRFQIELINAQTNSCTMAHYTELANRILQLRPLLSGAGDQTVEFFDEFLREHEFDSALHVICDFLIDSPAARISISTLNEIRDLHEEFRLEDECATKLEEKLQK